MYFIELLVKRFLKKKKTDNYNPLAEVAENPETTGCEHVFMPIDSSGETLACINCGLVVQRKDLKKKNIFKIERNS